MESRGVSLESLARKYRDTAEKQLKRHLILEKIISQENLMLADKDLTAALHNMAVSYGKPVNEIKSFYDQHPDKLMLFKQTFLEQQVIKLIRDSNIIEDVEPALEDQLSSSHFES